MHSRAPTSGRHDRDPLAPVEMITSVLLVALGAAVVLAVVLGVHGAVTDRPAGVSWATIGDPEACVSVPADGSVVGRFDASGNGVGRREGITGFVGPD